MGFFRREKPIHEQLAEEGGLDLAHSVDDLSPREPIDPRHPFWQITGIHGIPREREWDAVVSAEAPDLPGDQVDFVAVEDGTLFTDDDLPDGSLTPLADALEQVVDAPYHARAVRQGETVWSVAAMRTQVVEVPEDVHGDKVDIAVNEGARTLAVDDVESQATIPSLEEFGEGLFGSFVLHASRLDDLLWEVTVLPL